MESIPKLLIIEDEDLMLKALEFRLKKDGYQVFAAKDGATAIQLLQEHSFDLVLTDIMLPFVSGLEIVSRVKSDIFLKNTPVIVLSAVGLEKIILEAFELGADDFVTKPFNLNELTIRVKKHIRKPEYSHLSQAG